MVGVVKRVTGEFKSVCAMMASLFYYLCFKIDARGHLKCDGVVEHCSG